MEFRHFLHEGRTERRSLSQFAPRLPGAPQMAFMPLIVFLAVAFMIFGRGAAAAPITIEFQGAVSEIISYDAPDVACPGCAVPIGTEVIGRFSFTPKATA